MPEKDQTASTRNLIGTLLVRVVVPLWILTGAIFKLAEANPALLPRNILRYSQKATRSFGAELNLDVLLAGLISLEFLAVAVMVFVASLARPMAIFVLSLFCLILVGEIAAGNTSCGCLGAYSPNPWVMLAIDGGLLLGAILLKPLAALGRERAKWPLLAALAFVAITSFTSFTILTADRGREARDTPQELADGRGSAEAPAPRAVSEDPADESEAVGAASQERPWPDAEDAVVAGPPQADRVAAPPARAGYPENRSNPKPKPLPKHWYESDLSTWIGKPWREIELFQFMKKWPAGLEEGTRYVVFYSRTCEHCQEMFTIDLAAAPDLARQVSAVEVPDAVDKMNVGDTWEMPPTEVEHLELPMGTNWIITTPLSVRIEDGIVRCAEEGEHRACLQLE